MAAGNGRNIKDALVAMLQAVTYGAEPAFNMVLDNTRDEFSGSPNCLVLPDKLVSTVESNVTMAHKQTFSLVLHLPVEKLDTIEQAQYNQMYDLVDLVMNAVENGFYTDFVSQHAPNMHNYLMTCDQGTIRPVQSKIGPILMANMSVSVTYSQNVF
jgi:hypothetical protein